MSVASPQSENLGTKNHTNLISASSKKKNPSKKSRMKKASAKIFGNLLLTGTIPDSVFIGCFIREKNESIHQLVRIEESVSHPDLRKRIDHLCIMFDVHGKEKRLLLKDILGKR